MTRKLNNNWNPDFLEISPIFNSIHDVCLPFIARNKWPLLENFSAEFGKRKIFSQYKARIKSVVQAPASKIFEEHYESRIYLQGELQTRTENWHDYFNAMIWLQFPKIKAALNYLHFKSSQERHTRINRSPLENTITLFDECGAIVVTDDDSLVGLIRNHLWSELFVGRKEAFGKNIQCYVFGHAMHEKALSAYIGMTTQTIILKQKSDFFQKSYLHQLNIIDQNISSLWLESKITSTNVLQPLPLLGIPGWWKPPQDEEFYSNEDYFRKKNPSNRNRGC